MGPHRFRTVATEGRLHQSCSVNVVSDEWWMSQALAEADASAQAGDVPVGCVVVESNGRELSRAGNRREFDQDATAHAEILALRAACRQRGHWRLKGPRST